jgi:hypothetical protein
MPAPKATKAEKITKPRKTPVRKKEAVVPEVASHPSYDQIAELARKYWAERGYTDGNAEQDWLRAEQELLKIA